MYLILVKIIINVDIFGTFVDPYTSYMFQITQNIFLHVYTIDLYWYNHKL